MKSNRRRRNFTQTTREFWALLNEQETERDKMIQLAEQAEELAPSQEEADRYRAFRNALRGGRTLKWKHLQATTFQEIEDED